MSIIGLITNYQYRAFCVRLIMGLVRKAKNLAYNVGLKKLVCVTRKVAIARLGLDPISEPVRTARLGTLI